MNYQKLALGQLALSACLVLGNSPAHGWEFASAAELGVSASTNARRSGNDDQSDIIYTPSLLLQAAHQGPSVDLAANYNLRKRIFQREFFDDETVLTGGANLTWRALPERLSFQVSQARVETTGQSFGRNTPDDRQVLSTTDASSFLLFRPRSADQLQFIAGYTIVDSDDLALVESERANGAVRYVLGLSPTLNLALSASVGETRFDSDLASDIEQKTYAATLNRTAGALTWSATAGFSEFTPDGRDSVRSPIYQVNATYLLSTGTQLGVNASQTLTDRPNLLGRGQFARDDPTSIPFENTDLTDVLESRRVGITLSQPVGVNVLRMGLIYGESDFQNFPRDEERWNYSVSLSRPIRPNINGQISANYFDVDLNQLNADFRQFNVTVGSIWQISNKLSAAASIFYFDRAGDGAAGDFDDQGIQLTARYTFSGAGTGGRGGFNGGGGGVGALGGGSSIGRRGF